jgi:uncharacterized protein YcbX
MMTEINLIEPVQAHKALQTIWGIAKNNLVAGRKQVLTLADFDDSVTTKQRGYYHRFILTEIANQTVRDGKKYPMEVWKEHFRDKYLGDEVVTTIDPMTGIETKVVKPISTESLGVKKYNALIEQVTAFAVTELGVNFDQDFDQWCEEQAERFS